MSLSLRDNELSLRPLRSSDAAAWTEVRRQSAAWLSPWDATNPPDSYDEPLSFRAMVRHYRAEARSGRSLALAVLIDGTFRGQVTLGGIAWGSLRSGYIGYWIDRASAGHGYIPRAVALTADYAYSNLGLHRIEINIRPENTASLRVVEKLGFRYEGLRRRYLHIDGDWRDHHSYALCADEVPETGLISRVRRSSFPSLPPS
jgi:[ribosomal protein S5]-alanine N-acetyltransferase